MALLNFYKTYENIKPKIGTPGYLQDTDLLFTKDGHIVTHGVDYIPWGDGTIPIEKLPVDNTKVDNKHLWDSATIQTKINNSFLAIAYNKTSITARGLCNDNIATSSTPITNIKI